MYLSPEEAAEHCRLGATVWSFASSNGGLNPHVVLVGIGVEMTFEVVKAAELLRALEPALRVRVVNVTDLMVLGAETTHPHALDRSSFNELLTPDRTVLFNYHGYAVELQGLLFGRPGLDRMQVNGYREEGTTTTPFDMLLRNGVSRFDLAKKAIQAGAEDSMIIRNNKDELLREIDMRVEKVKGYIAENGKGKRWRAHLFRRFYLSWTAEGCELQIPMRLTPSPDLMASHEPSMG